jgi:hypothetical protein
MHETRADLQFLCDVGQGSLTGLLGYLVAKSLGCPLIFATGTIGFRERLCTRLTPKSSFVNDKIDLIGPKLDVPFDPLTAIMDLAAFFSTSGADCALLFGSHLHL